MGTSIVGITTIHLLQTFIQTPNAVNDPDFVVKMIIHAIFICSSMALSWIDTLHAKSELYEAKARKIEEELEAESLRMYYERKERKNEKINHRVHAHDPGSE
jgi:hypothetical protein